jgi:hypothetical protein
VNQLRALLLRLSAFLALGLIAPSCEDSDPETAVTPTPGSFQFSASEGGADPPVQSLTLTAAPRRLLFGRATWTATTDQPWLTVVPSSGTILSGESVTVAVQVQGTVQAEGWVGSTSTAAAPSAREDHDAVWTGTRMVLWGGEQGGLLDTGGFYNPAINFWTGATATTGAPTARTLHTAVWTGSQMIVWGGSTGSQPSSIYYNDGYRFNASTNTWLGTISQVNAPTPRSLHTAVWTGSRMIVWGGFDGIARTNTGGLYDPATDTWTGSTSTINAPVPRLHHVAVWTGTEMIIWGGQDAQDLSDGAGYDPAMDTWTPISNVGAPSARQAATAVWTGREMIVWGGSVLSGTRNAVDTGARYNPSTDTWVAATPTAGAPTARQSHSAVWTGTRMIVSHGASPAGGYFNTGGIYQPPIPAIGSHSATVTIVPDQGPPVVIPVTLMVTP